MPPGLGICCNKREINTNLGDIYDFQLTVQSYNQGDHIQFRVKFPVFTIFPIFFTCKNEHILFSKWPPPPVKP